MADCCSCTSQLAPIMKGDDAKIALQVVQPNGEKMNFNGKTVKFIIKQNKNADDETAIVLKTYDVVEDTTQITILLTSDDTDVKAGTYYYGIRIIDHDYQTTEGMGKVDIVQGPFYGK